MSMRNKQEIFSNLKLTLKTAELGLEDLKSSKADRKTAGLRNLIVFGRSVTNILQQLRNIESDFETWYSKFVEEMQNDPLMKFLYKLRSEVLKEGVLKTAHSMYIKKLDSSNMGQIGTPPPNAKSTFIGDQIGGIGWIVELPDGTTEKYYGNLPVEIGTLSTYFPENPKSHLGKDLDKKTIEELGEFYFNYLKNLVHLSEEKFNPKTS